jgi:hypothetical protein
MNSWRAEGITITQGGMKGSSAQIADAIIEAYTKCAWNMRRVSQVNTAWNNASCRAKQQVSSILGPYEQTASS